MRMGETAGAGSVSLLSLFPFRIYIGAKLKGDLFMRDEYGVQNLFQCYSEHLTIVLRQILKNKP